MNITIELPDFLPDLLQKTKKETEVEMKTAMAIQLFEWGRVSSGIAAKLAGMERVQFLLELHRYNIPMIDLDEDELLQDIKNA